MTTVTVTLDDTQSGFIEAEVAKGGHGDAAEYVRALIEKDRERVEHLEFVESLREAIEGPATVMTREDWDDIRAEAMRLIADGKRP